jgi:hypothetical protein
MDSIWNIPGSVKTSPMIPPFPNFSNSCLATSSMGNFSGNYKFSLCMLATVLIDS